MKDEIIEWEIIQEDIKQLQDEQEEIKHDIQILWELYGSDNTINDEKIQATALIISIAVLLILLIVSLIIGLKLTGGI